MAKEAKEDKPLLDYSEMYSINPDIIPTGVMPLDTVLGGGYEKGDLIAITSSPGVGKCLTGSTRVQTQDGYVRISSLYPFPKVGFNRYKTLVSTRFGECATSHFYYEPNCKVYKLHLSDGSVVNGTALHRICSDKTGDVSLVPIKDFQVGDTVLKSPKSHFKTSADNGLSIEQLYALGLFIGDGIYTHSKGKISPIFMGNKDSLNYISSTGYLGKISKCLDKDCYYSHASKEGKQFLFKYVPDSNSSNKTVPEVVFLGSYEQKMAFILGYLDSDGSFYDSTIEFTSKSENLIYSLSELLDSMGIGYRIKRKILGSGAYKGNLYHRLYVNNEDYKHFLSVPIPHSKKQRAIGSYLIQRKTINSQNYITLNKAWETKYLQYLLNSSDYSYLKRQSRVLRDILNHLKSGRRTFSKDRLLKCGHFLPSFIGQFIDYRQVKVVKIETSVEDVYDLTVPSVHEFMAQGMVNHNTTCLLSAAKNFIKKGQKVAYADSEKGVKKGILDNFGLTEVTNYDPREAKFWLIKPDTYSQVEMIAMDAVKFGFDHLIIDSMTSCVTSENLDEVVSENVTIGVNARIEAVLYPKLKALGRLKGLTIWVVQQMRTKMEKQGMGMKVSMDSAGGYSAKHTPDVRIFMNTGPKLVKEKIQSVVSDEEDIIYGNMARIWTEKNRNAPGFIKIPCPVIFGKGVSNLMYYEFILKRYKYLTGGAGGFYKLKLGEEEISIRGTSEVPKLIKSKAKEIRQLIIENHLSELKPLALED